MNTTKENGISIGISRIDEFYFMKITINGTLTHKDYELMAPMLRDSIKESKHPKIKVVIDATNFKGWEIEAIWDDFKFGMEFKDLFTRIAFIGTKSWEEYGVKIGNWFMNGEMKFFESFSEAYIWINQKEIITSTATEKDLSNRKESIEDELESLFESNLRVTDFNVPEADDQNASKIIINILEKKLEKIKIDINHGKYKNY